MLAAAPREWGCGTRVVRGDGQAIAPAVLDAVERLDDTMFAALAGDATALDRAPDEWQRVRRVVVGDLVDEARAQYVERAANIWSDYRNGDELDVVRAFAALDVLLMLSSD
jgi:hypothetical protein